MQRSALLRVEVQVDELLGAGDAEQAVADDEVVVEEAERAGAVEAGEPEAEFGHLDRHGVDVDAVDAVGDDVAAGVELVLLCQGELRADRALPGCRHSVAGVDVSDARAAAGAVGVLAAGLPSEPVGEVAGRGDEERAAAGGDVADLQVCRICSGVLSTQALLSSVSSGPGE